MSSPVEREGSQLLLVFILGWSLLQLLAYQIGISCAQQRRTSASVTRRASSRISTPHVGPIS